MPHIVVLGDGRFPQELLYLRVSVCHYAVKCHLPLFQQGKASLQALQLHMVASSHLIALQKQSHVHVHK